MVVPDHMERWIQYLKAQQIQQIIAMVFDFIGCDMESAAYVWLALDAHRVRGCGLQTDCCPVARYLQRFIKDGIIHVYDDRYRVVMDDNSVVVGPLPYAVREFIRMFDNGDFPSLVDYNHRHGQLPLSQAG